MHYNVKFEVSEAIFEGTEAEYLRVPNIQSPIFINIHLPPGCSSCCNCRRWPLLLEKSFLDPI